MMARDQSGVRGRLASTLESVCRAEFADNDRGGLQSHAGDRVQQRTLVIQVGTKLGLSSTCSSISSSRAEIFSLISSSRSW